MISDCAVCDTSHMRLVGRRVAGRRIGVLACAAFALSHLMEPRCQNAALSIRDVRPEGGHRMTLNCAQGIRNRRPGVLPQCLRRCGALSIEAKQEYCCGFSNRSGAVSGATMPFFTEGFPGSLGHSDLQVNRPVGANERLTGLCETKAGA